MSVRPTMVPHGTEENHHLPRPKNGVTVTVSDQDFVAIRPVEILPITAHAGLLAARLGFLIDLFVGLKKPP